MLPHSSACNGQPLAAFEDLTRPSCCCALSYHSSALAALSACSRPRDIPIRACRCFACSCSVRGGAGLAVQRSWLAMFPSRSASTCHPTAVPVPSRCWGNERLQFQPNSTQLCQSRSTAPARYLAASHATGDARSTTEVCRGRMAGSRLQSRAAHQVQGSASSLAFSGSATD